MRSNLVAQHANQEGEDRRLTKLPHGDRCRNEVSQNVMAIRHQNMLAVHDGVAEQVRNILLPTGVQILEFCEATQNAMNSQNLESYLQSVAHVLLQWKSPHSARAPHCTSRSDLLELRQEVRMLRLQQPTDVRIEKSTPRIMGISSSVAVLVVNAVHLRPDEDRG